ncbi:MAG: hypothetical protein HND47_18585 [Chloroflexi bacterium]|nr:hypothetical protein [Chloroflexota bacterium]
MTAILIVPTQATPGTIEDCAKRGVKAAVIVSAGFREVGAEGAALESQCVEIARAHGVRLLGPNCIGTVDTHLPLDTTFLQPPMPDQGGIGFISHSGAFAAAIVDWARAQGFGFSRIVSLGNQADVNETDMLPMLADDPHTKVIVMYMESISNGRRFVQTASEAAKRKPVIALKVGASRRDKKPPPRTPEPWAASDTAFDAALKKRACSAPKPPSRCSTGRGCWKLVHCRRETASGFSPTQADPASSPPIHSNITTCSLPIWMNPHRRLYPPSSRPRQTSTTRWTCSPRRRLKSMPRV